MALHERPCQGIAWVPAAVRRRDVLNGCQEPQIARARPSGH
jgi:hypothetical protein